MMKKINRVNSLRTNLSRLSLGPKTFIFNELIDIQNGTKPKHPTIPDAFHISSDLWGSRIGGIHYAPIKEQLFQEVEAYGLKQRSSIASRTQTSSSLSSANVAFVGPNHDVISPGDILCPDGCSKDGALVLSARQVDAREERARNMRYVDTTRSELTSHVIYHYKMCTSPSPHFVEADLLMANGSVREQVMELEVVEELDRRGWILRDTNQKDSEE